MPQPATEEEAKLREDLRAKREALATAQQATATDKLKLQKLKDVRTRIVAFREEMTRFAAEIEDMLDDAGMPADDKVAFRPVFPEDTEPQLVRHEATLKAAIAEREGTTQSPAEGTIRWLRVQLKELEKHESADKVRHARINEIHSRMTSIDAETQRIGKEIDQIEGPEKERIAAVRRERLNAYAAYFANLRQEQDTLEELYAPVSARLGTEESGRAGAGPGILYPLGGKPRRLAGARHRPVRPENGYSLPHDGGSGGRGPENSRACLDLRRTGTRPTGYGGVPHWFRESEALAEQIYAKWHCPPGRLRVAIRSRACTAQLWPQIQRRRTRKAFPRHKGHRPTDPVSRHGHRGYAPTDS